METCGSLTKIAWGYWENLSTWNISVSTSKMEVFEICLCINKFLKWIQPHSLKKYIYATVNYQNTDEEFIRINLLKYKCHTRRGIKRTVNYSYSTLMKFLNELNHMNVCMSVWWMKIILIFLEYLQRKNILKSVQSIFLTQKKWKYWCNNYLFIAIEIIDQQLIM